jgi:hypothetical protein
MRASNLVSLGRASEARTDVSTSRCVFRIIIAARSMFLIAFDLFLIKVLAAVWI